MTMARVILREQTAAGTEEVQQKLGLAELAWDNGFVRKTVLIIVLALIWEIYGRALDNVLLFPTLTETIRSLISHVVDGSLPARAWASIQVLLMGYAAGVAMAGALTILAINTRLGSDFLETMTAMLSP